MFVSKVSLGLLFLVVVATCGCGSGTTENLPTANLDSAPTHSVDAPADTTSEGFSSFPSLRSDTDPEPAPPQVEKFPEVTIATSLGNIRVRLDGEKAAETVDSFLYNYVDRGFYKDTIFHFVQDGFIAIAGGYAADLEEKTVGPPIRNEAGNGVKNIRGTIAMSRHPEYADSATSQFYFNLADNASLDQTDAENGETFGYCVFGEVIEGLDVLEKIAKVEVHDSGEFTNVPVEPIVIQSVRRDK